MKNIYTIFFISIFFFFNSAQAQNRYFEWMNVQTHAREQLDLESKIYFREVQAGKWKSLGTFTLDTNVLYDLPQKIATKFFYLKNFNQVLFTIAGTGKVYQFDLVKKILTRLDKTYFKGYNFDAPQFVRNDTLYSFGGHGFWTYSKTLAFYDQDIQEWQNIRAENYGPNSFTGGYQGYAKQNDTFYSGAAETEAGLKNFNRVFSDSLYALDFKTLKWKLLGQINPVLPFISVRDVYWDGAHFIHLAPDRMYLIDPAKNEVLEIINPKYFHLRNFYTIGDSIFSFWENQRTQLKLSKKALLKEAKYVGKFYKNQTYVLYAYLFGVLALITVGLIVFYRYIKSKELSVNSGRNSANFGFLERSLLKKLMEVEEHSGKFISVLQINEILNLENKSPENQRRIRTKFLNDLNLKLLINFQVQDAIERFQYEEDKRLTMYRLKEEVKPGVITLF